MTIEALNLDSATLLDSLRELAGIEHRGVTFYTAAGQTFRVSYGELVAGRQLDLRLDRSAKRKPKSEWTILGRSEPRVDMAAMAAGTFEFVHNLRVPGMLHGAVVRPPASAPSVASVDESSIRGIPGVVKIVVKKNFVGVVAEKPWNALRAASALKVTWSGGEPLPAQTELYAWLRTRP